MEFVEKVGNIKVYIEENAANDITVILKNGTDIVASEVYFTNNKETAIEELFTKLDTYTLNWLSENRFGFVAAGKMSGNTYQGLVDENDWFCRIDDTRFFKHYYKPESEFIADKNGERIIDR